MSRRIRLIGIGAGDPGYLTLQAVAAMRATDVFLLLAKGAETRDLADLRAELCRTHLPADGTHRFATREDPERVVDGPGPYREAIADWRRRRADRVAEMLRDEVAPGESAAFLVWGDPTLYDSTLGILADVADRGAAPPFSVEVVPGISAVSALAARHAVSLNRVGGAVQVTPGRLLADGWPAGVDDVVVMLDATLAFRAFPAAEILWGAYLGTPDERLVAGRVAEVGEEIARIRAAARERKGWMFDTYLLRRA